MNLLDIFTTLADFLQDRFEGNRVTMNMDTGPFRMHHRVTAVLLLLAALLMFVLYSWGHKIACTDGIDKNQNFVEKYCWSRSSFTLYKSITSHTGDSLLGTLLPLVTWDIIPHVSGLHPKDMSYAEPDQDAHNEVIANCFYQWVPLLLFLQAIFFCVPYSIWKYYENGMLWMIIKDLRDKYFETRCEEVREKLKKRVATYLANSFNMNNAYCYWFYMCEAMSFINVTLQLIFVNGYLGEAITTHGFLGVIRLTMLDQNSRSDSLISVFPRAITCSFFKIGPSGTIVNSEAICFLGLNIINEKLFIFIWLWLLVLAIISLASLLLNALAIVSPSYRKLKLAKYFNNNNILKKLAPKLQVGDFFMISRLANNLTINVFKEVMEELSNMISPPVDDVTGRIVLQTELDDIS